MARKKKKKKCNRQIRYKNIIILTQYYTTTTFIGVIQNTSPDPSYVCILHKEQQFQTGIQKYKLPLKILTKCKQHINHFAKTDLLAHVQCMAGLVALLSFIIVHYSVDNCVDSEFDFYTSTFLCDGI